MLANLLYGVLALIVFAAIFAVAYLFYRRGANREALVVKVPPGVRQQRFVRIGGIDQWVSVRGEDAANPVLLFLHGGPGGAMSDMIYLRQHPLEAHFTIAHWDQRGAGRTFARSGKAGAGEMTVDRMARDGIEVAEWLRREFGKEKLVLVGASWGSLLGTEMVKRRPDLFSAYVGTGQVVNMQQGEAVSYAALMEQLKARSETNPRAAKDIAALEAIGPPPYPSRKALLAQRRVLFRAGSAADRGLMRSMPLALLTAPGVDLKIAMATIGGSLFSIDALYDELMAYDIRRLGTRFETPMIYLQGADDIQTPTVLVEAYFKEVEAPSKALVLLGDGAAHMAAITHLEAFGKALVEALGKVGVT